MVDATAALFNRTNVIHLTTSVSQRIKTLCITRLEHSL